MQQFASGAVFQTTNGCAVQYSGQMCRFEGKIGRGFEAFTISLIARHIDGMVESANEQYGTLLEAGPKPYVLDGYTVFAFIQSLWL